MPTASPIRQSPATTPKATARTPRGDSHNVREIDYPGLLPAFGTFGDCGTHPQFKHLASPPEGYRFVATNPGNGPFPKAWRQILKRPDRGLRTAWSACRLMWRCRRNGLRFRDAARFVRSRGWASQMYLTRSHRPRFTPSVPFTFGDQPWFIEIEDVVSLFFPYINNGATYKVRVTESPAFNAVKCLLEDDNCRAIITHVRDTAAAIPKLFQSERITAKTFNVPVGVKTPDKPPTKPDTGTVNFLFTTSWSQRSDQFYTRGGLEVLAAFRELSRRFRNVRLTLRTALPKDLPPFCYETVRQPNVEHIEDYLTDAEMTAMLNSAHVCVLPSARIHVVSVLQAMANGIVPIVSDGWAMRELVTDRETGLVVPGRYGRVSWTDSITGMLREDYRPMRQLDPAIVERLVAAGTELIRNSPFRRELAERACQYVSNEHSLDLMNERLKSVFDRVL